MKYVGCISYSKSYNSFPNKIQKKKLLNTNLPKKII